MSNEWKACPFCGSLSVREGCDTPDAKWHYVECDDCHATSKADLGVSGAIENWNTRPMEDTLRKQLEGMESDYESACVLVAKMHEAAVGGIRGPIAGVVEDVLNLRTKLDVAVKALRDDVLILLHEIQSSQKGSIGSIDNTYLPQMSRRNIDAMEKRINKALAEIEGSD